MKTNKVTIFVLCVLISIISMMAAGCSKSDNKSASEEVDASHSYSFWTPLGEDSSYYNSYNDNPGVEYLMSKTWKDENGKESKISLNFMVPAAGTAGDNLNTIISTGDYTDMMDMNLFNGSILDLYEEGIVLDITPYVENYMPNYLKFLDAHPDYKKTATNVVDGEKKYLQIYGYGNVIEPWAGYMYRRDWLVKYGKNPDDGSAFSGEYTTKKEDGTDNLDSWKDNVVFPSGGSDPIYISDWEWMLGIFQTALQEEEITDGYSMSLYYPGYLATGDLVSAFGGGGGHWFKNKESKAEFGLTSDNFRVYLQCMNTWYKNGWIDKAFTEHASDMFYAIDDVSVRQGKVGLWYGLVSQLAGKSDTGEDYTKGMVVYGAREPINDIYGSEAQKNVEPYCFYQVSLEGGSTVLTNKAKDKDMASLFTMLDYMYSEEGIILHTMGLSKEQYEATKNELYTEKGLTEGAYTISADKNAEGLYEIELVDPIKKEPGLASPVRLAKFTGIYGIPEGYAKVNSESEVYNHSMDEFIAYTNTGYFLGSYKSQISGEDTATCSKIDTQLTEFGAKSIPIFIQGDKDPFNDDDWQAYLKAINKYQPEIATNIYQNLIDQLK